MLAILQNNGRYWLLAVPEQNNQNKFFRFRLKWSDINLIN